MLKEIFEQPNSVRDSMRGRLNTVDGLARLGGLNMLADEMREIRRVIILGCGTSWHAALIGEYMLEEHARIPVEVEYASEFRYRNPIVDQGTMVLVISQSGETADTLGRDARGAAQGRARRSASSTWWARPSRANRTAASTSTPARDRRGLDQGVHQPGHGARAAHARARAPARDVARDRRRDRARARAIPARSSDPPAQRRGEAIAELYGTTTTSSTSAAATTSGRARGRAQAQGDLVHPRRGLPGGEMKHGPIALIDENMPVVFICTRDSAYDKVMSNMMEVRARKGRIIAIATEGDTEWSRAPTT
jgi:glucosamine--fructose-6-phosphate aminotransferase (isomerizing)